MSFDTPTWLQYTSYFKTKCLQIYIHTVIRVINKMNIFMRLKLIYWIRPRILQLLKIHTRGLKKGEDIKILVLLKLLAYLVSLDTNLGNNWKKYFMQVSRKGCGRREHATPSFFWRASGKVVLEGRTTLVSGACSNEGMR